MKQVKQSAAVASAVRQIGAENVDVADAETAAVSQEDVEEMCDKGRPILIQLVKAAVDAGPAQPGLGKLGIAIAGHLGHSLDLGTVIGIAIAGVECGHELHRVQERIAVLTQQCLRVEEVSFVIQKWDARYAEEGLLISICCASCCSCM